MKKRWATHGIFIFTFLYEPWRISPLLSSTSYCNVAVKSFEGIGTGVWRAQGPQSKMWWGGNVLPPPFKDENPLFVPYVKNVKYLQKSYLDFAQIFHQIPSKDTQIFKIIQREGDSPSPRGQSKTALILPPLPSQEQFPMPMKSLKSLLTWRELFLSVTHYYNCTC